jgi:uncharacterized protein YciI
MAWYVVMSKSIGPREAIRGLEDQNLSWMKTNHDAGKVLFSGPTSQGVGIWVLRASSMDDARALVADHPWVKAGLRDVSEIYEWNVQQALGIGRFEGPPPPGVGVGR